MTPQSVYDQWAHLRWCHCYQWKNLLDAEREARAQLERSHQHQVTQFMLDGQLVQAARVLGDQLRSLTLLRQQQRQKLKERQAQQLDVLRQQLVQQGKSDWLDSFGHLSVLRRS